MIVVRFYKLTKLNLVAHTYISSINLSYYSGQWITVIVLRLMDVVSGTTDIIKFNIIFKNITD